MYTFKKAKKIKKNDCWHPCKEDSLDQELICFAKEEFPHTTNNLALHEW